MQHPDYKKPLEFRTVHSFIPPTPNLQQIKRTNMKLKILKPSQQQTIKIMTPRSTRNLHSQVEKKKSFRNLSLVLDCESGGLSGNANEGKHRQNSNELRERSQNSSNHPVISEGISYEGKQNISVGQFNMNMKKKSKQGNNIEFKEVKSTKNKRFSQEILPKDHLHEKTIIKHNNNQNRHESLKIQQMPRNYQNTQQYNSNNIPYANEFESSTYQNHYKASTLSAFNQSLNLFAEQISSAQVSLQSQFSSHEQNLSQALSQITHQFTEITYYLTHLYQSTLHQTTEYLTRLKSEHKSTMKQLQDMRKSISRYQADISTHYNDIVRELEFSCFQDIMTKYQRKMEYFEQQVTGILEKNFEEPSELDMWKKMIRFVGGVRANDCGQNGIERTQRQDNERDKKLLLEKMEQNFSSRRDN